MVRTILLRYPSDEPVESMPQLKASFGSKLLDSASYNWVALLANRYYTIKSCRIAESQSSYIPDNDHLVLDVNRVYLLLSYD